MSLTQPQAVDEIYGVLNDAWTPSGLPLYFEDTRSERTAEEIAWAVAFIRHAAGFQATLCGEIGQRTFTRLGYITVQIFSPVARGLHEARALAKVVTDAYEGFSTPGGVWFRNVRMNEVGREGDNFQVNVVAEFRYDEIR